LKIVVAGTSVNR